MTDDRDLGTLEEASDPHPSGVGNRARARIVDSLLYMVACAGLLFAADLVVLSGFGVGFISVGVLYPDPLQLSVGIRTLALPDSDLWATIFLLYWPIVILVPMLLYEVPLVALRGQTPGKILGRVKVVAVMDGNPPGWGRSCTRCAVLCLPLLVPFGVVLSLVIAMSPLFSPDRRGWHDRIAGTTVVDDPCDEPNACPHRERGSDVP